ncbi:DNA-binding GntR family transcriptional regulator [Actinoplanes lobatus]|uniref:DNA-binding GntR family transcriptional regulator n=1 Tax=Actinoplanes lobatus TaxID=113568 RepID=A0A7W7MM18_9ACTN|nr:DNA-binding GntR family transcriptional regulator [Actinoplanes lobatus]
MHRTSFDSTGTTVEHSDNPYRADPYAIKVTVFNH